MPKKRHLLGPLPAVKKKGKHMPDGPLSPKEIELFGLLKAREYRQAIALVPEVENINAVDPETGMAALHFVAARGVKGLLKAIWQRDDLDELARDAQDRYASELAWQVAGNEELGVELMHREKAYGETTQQAVWPKPDME